ncbi:MAG: GNAT family N-acetyltransferase [Pseudomonadota bacterium]
MSPPHYLIDTNVFIGLEDDQEIHSDFSSLLNLTGKNGVKVFIHEAAKDDIERDKITKRKKISLSKLDKFQVIKKVKGLTPEKLANQFGPLPKPNDVVDAQLLHALAINIADFLVTEDGGLHKRVAKYAPEISGRVLYVGDAVSLLTSTYEPTRVPFRAVEEVDAHTIPKDDRIFESLRDDYDGFDSWWEEKCVKKFRKCWIVDDGGIAGILVRKDETKNDTDATIPANKILKICTFKVRPENRGIKLGELLLKQALWYAQSNNYDLAYVTTYPKQEALIGLLEYYGFQKTIEAKDGELTYERRFSRERIRPLSEECLYDLARSNYPRFCTRNPVEAFGIPIRESYHDELFPELNQNTQQDFFEPKGLSGNPRRPGNTIRKVYLCRAQANLVKPGSLLFFYKGKSHFPPSQALTVVGIFEDMSLAKSTGDLLTMTGGRSVYSQDQLSGWNASAERPVKVINFLLAAYIAEAITLPTLKEKGVMGAHPQQSIFKIPRDNLDKLLPLLGVNFEV